MPDTNGVKTIEHAQGNGPNDHKEAEEHDVLLEKERKKSEKEEDEERIEGSPMDRAFFFSKYVSFWWMNALFAKGSKKSLEEGDLDDPPKADKADGLCEKLERNWQLEAYGRDGNFKSKPSLIKVFWKTFGAQYILLGLFALVTEALRIAQPVLLGKLVAYFSTGSKVTTMEAYLYAMGMTLCSLGITLHIIPFQFLRQKIGMQARIGTCGLVYKKVLNLSNAALASTTTGYIVNLVSSDAQKLDFAAMFLHYLWLGPIEVIVMAYLLYQELGWPSFVGIGVLLLLGPAQMAMGRLLMAFRRKIMKWTDQRIKIMNEVIAGMRVIKLYTWEKSFAKLVANIRAHEMKAIAKLCYLRACFMSFFFSSGSLISFVTFITYALSGNILTSAKVFTSMALFNTAKLVMTLYLPIGITFFNEARVACERIQRFLTMEDITKPGEEKSNFRPKSSDCGVFIENLTAAWTEDQSTLEDISLTAKEAELVAVVGPVGCGKSSLLMAVLGELPAKEGKVDVKGKIAYASQQAWVFNGTLRYNVTFGQEFDEDRYREVLKVCALERDIELLAEGDMTLVGERGVSLSGGQRARVNLARAVYADADIYIMDDPLSAVDAHVGRHLFDQCINGYLAKKPRILVTHQLQYLTDADNIIALSNGKCIGQGTFYELTDMGIDFMTLLTEEDNVESGIEIDIEEAEDRQRRFSKQESCALIPREKAGSFLRQESRFRRRASSFLRQESRIRDSSIMSSEFGIAEHAEQVEVIDDEGVLPKEKKAEGAIGYSVYLDFFKAGYGLVVWGFVALLFAICQAVYLLADYWLSYWTSKEEKYYYSKRTAKDLEKVNRKRDLLIYSVLVVSLVVLGLTRAFVFFKVILKASQSLHGKMFGSLLRAPVYFFDTNSIESLNGSGITALKFCPSNRNGQLQLPQACLTLNRLGGRICLQDGSFLCCAETGDLATETNEDNDFTTAIHIVIILCFIGHLCYPQGPAEMFGRILNRFSKDMSLVDDMLSFTFFDFVQTLLVVTGILILVGSAQPIVFAVVVPLVIVFFLLRRYYIRTAREVKRLEGTTRSPVFGHFSTTLLGLPTIRAFGVQPQFTDMFFDYQDGHTKAWFAFLGCGNWLGFRLELLCLTFVAFVSFVSVAIFGACKNVKSKTARPRARATIFFQTSLVDFR